MLVYLCSMYKISPVSLHKIQTVLSSISIQHRLTYLSLADFSSHSKITITLRERQEIRPSKREPCFIMGILYQSTIANTTLFQQISQKFTFTYYVWITNVLLFDYIFNFIYFFTRSYLYHYLFYLYFIYLIFIISFKKKYYYNIHIFFFSFLFLFTVVSIVSL